MAKQYETVFIMTPVLSEELIDETVKKYTKIIKDGGGEMVNTDSWGLRKLAYPIQKKSPGYYYCLEFKGSGKPIPPMELAFKRDEKILRFLTVKLDKHAIAFNIKDREKRKTKKKESAAKKEVEVINN